MKQSLDQGKGFGLLVAGTCRKVAKKCVEETNGNTHSFSKVRCAD